MGIPKKPTKSVAELEQQLIDYMNELHEAPPRLEALRAEMQKIEERKQQLEGNWFGGLINQTRKELGRAKNWAALEAAGTFIYKGLGIRTVTSKRIYFVVISSDPLREVWIDRDEKNVFGYKTTAIEPQEMVTVKEVLEACRAAGMKVPKGPEGQED